MHDLLELLTFVDFSFPGCVTSSGVANLQFRLNIAGVGPEMFNLLETKKFRGVRVVEELTNENPPLYGVNITIQLETVSSHLCSWLAARRCWGELPLRQWIDILQTYARGGY